jgi:phosphatidylinositol kinase/protein kinase (PI-3  family)
MRFFFIPIFICSGFFRSVALRNQDALQDILRLLTLWFKFGQHDEVSHAMGSGFVTVEVDTWLQVIPQVNFNSTKREKKLIIF